MTVEVDGGGSASGGGLLGGAAGPQSVGVPELGLQGRDEALIDAVVAAGEAGDDTAVADLTGVLSHFHTGDQLGAWPGDMRVIVRREPIAAGKQVSLFEQLGAWVFNASADSCG